MLLTLSNLTVTPLSATIQARTVFSRYSVCGFLVNSANFSQPGQTLSNRGFCHPLLLPACHSQLCPQRSSASVSVCSHCRRRSAADSACTSSLFHFPSMASSAPLIGSAGEGALLIRFGTGIDLEVSEAVLGCLSRLDRDESSSRPDGITDIVPAYAALLVHFDPLRVHRNAVMEWVRSHLSTSESKTAKQPRQIEIPVQYGGKHGLDIDEVAQLTSLGSAAGQPQFLPTDLPPLAKPLTCLVTCCRSCADSLRGRVPRLLPRISWGVSIPRWPASAPDKRPEVKQKPSRGIDDA